MPNRETKRRTKRETKRETKRPLVLAAIILAMFMAAVEGTIVATAMPSIVGDLGGFSLFTWVFSAFLLTQAVTIPIYGKIADLYGRKPVFTFGIVVFLIASLFCGLARTMQMLILFRLLQGIGAGAVQPIAMTVVGDIYSMEERAKVQGYVSSVWGISSIIGPLAGGFFVQYLHWAWVFWINIPLGVISLAGVWMFLHENVHKKRHELDFLGAGLLLTWLGALMTVMIQAGTAWPWFSVQVIGMLVIALTMFILFLQRESRAAEPVMPLGVWRDPLISVANLASLTTGALMIGVTSFLPTFVQGVLRQSPTVAGFTLTVMSIGWPIASTLAGRLMLRHSYRAISLIGGIILVGGAGIFIYLPPEGGPAMAGAGSFLIGAGMGLTSTTFLVAIQSSVDWKARGVATASNMFMRILGNTLGAAMLGGIMNIRMASFLKANASLVGLPARSDTANLLLDPQRSAALGEGVRQILQKGLALSLHGVYLGVLMLALVSLGLVILLPKARNRPSEGY